jgi:predicted transcriptional regulator
MTLAPCAPEQEIPNIERKYHAAWSDTLGEERNDCRSEVSGLRSGRGERARRGGFFDVCRDRDMILTIELTPDQEARLQAEADAKGSDPESVLQRLVETLPAARVDRRRTTTAEIAAGWKASGLPSVYGRDPRDATVIARELRAEAARRHPEGARPQG